MPQFNGKYSNLFPKLQKFSPLSFFVSCLFIIFAPEKVKLKFYIANG